MITNFRISNRSWVDDEEGNFIQKEVGRVLDLRMLKHPFELKFPFPGDQLCRNVRCLRFPSTVLA